MRARVLKLAHGALAAIESARQRIDDLNVYPVPDGDTGSNLAQTVRAVVDALAASSSEDRVELAREATHAALLGARGNSGVILSQIVRGAAGELAESGDPARALRAASDTAYAAVRDPTEGTMLTAIRELAEEAEAGGDLRAIVVRGDDCVARTRKMLPVLTEAGVVDAGAAGLVEILRGIAAAAAGEPLPAGPATTMKVADEAIHQRLSRYRYCTTFFIEGRGLDRGKLERELEELGDSLLVVGDIDALKVHVHTDDPGRALSLGVSQGTIGGIEIANMHEQTRERERRLLAPRVSLVAVAVADGAGNRRLLESLGARVVDGNPSTGELLAAIEAAHAEEVIVLPDDRNVLLAAEHAAAQAPVTVHVLPTETLQAGLAAMVAFDPARPADENLAAMGAAADAVATGAVTVASRDIERNGVVIRKGQWLGLASGEPIAGESTFDGAARSVVERLLAGPRDVLTLIAGEGSPPLENLLAAVAAGHPDVEVEVYDGGQPRYALLISAE
jgi:DAK2 domain fusion protein YloV